MNILRRYQDYVPKNVKHEYTTKMSGLCDISECAKSLKYIKQQIFCKFIFGI